MRLRTYYFKSHTMKSLCNSADIFLRESSVYKYCTSVISYPSERLLATRTQGVLMFRNTLKRSATAVALSFLLGGGMAAATAGPASAATVPNRFYCNPNGGWCYQVNGAFVPGIIIQCHWKRSGMSGKPHQLYYTSCQSWASDVP